MDKIEKLSRKFLNDSDIEAGMIVAHMKNGRTMRAFTGNMVDISVLYAVGIIELAKQFTLKWTHCRTFSARQSKKSAKHLKSSATTARKRSCRRTLECSISGATTNESQE